MISSWMDQIYTAVSDAWTWLKETYETVVDYLSLATAILLFALVVSNPVFLLAI